jgi:hypothetical protein
MTPGKFGIHTATPSFLQIVVVSSSPRPSNLMKSSHVADGAGARDQQAFGILNETKMPIFEF